MGKKLLDRMNHKGENRDKDVEASMTRKGVPQGGPGSPGFWREYTLDMIMTLHEDWDTM